MTWKELAAMIASLSKEQQEKPVLFIQDYDGEDRRHVLVNMVQAHEEVWIGFDIGSEHILSEGDFYLSEIGAGEEESV